MATNVHALVLFDGVCNLCNASVDFILKRDKKDYFRFASLQSAAALEITNKFKLPPGTLDSLLLQENDKLFMRSTAALRIARHLGGAWPILYGFIVIPKPIRDFFYDVIAKNRYWLFGKRESCRVATLAERAKFL